MNDGMLTYKALVPYHRALFDPGAAAQVAAPADGAPPQAYAGAEVGIIVHDDAL